MLFALWVCLTSQQQVLNIAGLYAYPTAGYSGTVPAAVQLALNHINANQTILRDYTLNITFRDSGCSNIIAVRSLFDFIIEPETKYVGVLGAFCSLATDVIAEMAIAYNLSVISYASTSPSLTNDVRYPELLLGTPSDINTVTGQLLIIKEYNIQRLVIINEQEELFVSISTRLQLFLDQIGVAYVTNVFNPRAQDYLNTIDSILNSIQVEGYSVVVINVREERYVEVMCRLRKYPALHPPRTTWIVLGWYVDWSSDVEGYTGGECTFEEIAEVTSGSLAVNPTVNFQDFDLAKQPTISGYTARQLYLEYESMVVNDQGREFFERQSVNYDAYAYDSTWTMALALDKLSAKYNLSEVQFSSYELFNAMQQTTFSGWTGEVLYVDRVRPDSMVQILEVINASFSVRGLYINIPINQSEVIGNKNNISYMPIATFTVFDPNSVTDGIEVHHIHTAIFALTVVFFLLGTAYVTTLIVIIVIGWVKKCEAVTKSEPLVNIVVISGNYIIFLQSLLRATEGRYVDTSSGYTVSTFICHLHVWLFAVSISIIFGAMLGRAIKYYVIAIKHKFSYAAYLQFYHILLIPVFLVIIDTVYTLVWGLVSPTTYAAMNIPSGLVYPPIFQVSECTIGNQTNYIILFAVFILYKGALVLLGLFLAYHLRKVVNKANKYSSTITWTMYNVVIFSIIQIVLLATLTNIDIKYGLVCLLSLLEGFTISSIVAAPILYYLYTDPHGKTFRPVHGRQSFPENPEMLKMKIRTLEGKILEMESKFSGDVSENKHLCGSPEEIPEKKL